MSLLDAANYTAAIQASTLSTWCYSIFASNEAREPRLPYATGQYRALTLCSERPRCINFMSQPPQFPEVPAVAHVQGAEVRHVTIDGVHWRYLFAGSGPPLLLIHGFLGYSWSWRFNIAPLSRHFSVYAPDLPGCGFSPRLAAKECALTGDAERLLAFMRHFDMQSADLVGSSRGGGLAIILAALAAQQNELHRVRRLVLVSPINPWSTHGRLLTRVLATSLGGLYVLHVQPHLPSVARRYFTALYGDPRRITPGTFEAYAAGLQAPGSFEHLLKILRSWRHDLAAIGDSLPAISLPTLLLWGSRDRAVYPASAFELHQRLENSSVVTLDGVGHLPYEEVPEEFNRILCDFLLPNVPAQTTAGISAATAEPTHSAS